MASTYTTRNGDMWDGISFRVYGTERYMDLLIAANPTQNTVVLFDAGTVLTAPDLPDPVRPSSLPPWRR